MASPGILPNMLGSVLLDMCYLSVPGNKAVLVVALL